MRFASVQSIVSALVFRMLGIFPSTLFSMVEHCRVLVRMYNCVCVVITYNCSIPDLRESANSIIKSFAFRLFAENMHCTVNFYLS